MVTFDPRLPSIPAIQQKQCRSMTLTDPYLKEVFPEPPLVAFKRQRNIKDHTIRAKVPPPFNPRPRRMVKGMRRCNKPCGACPFIREGKTIKLNNTLWNITQDVHCGTSNIIYIIECNIDKCKLRYIGESE